ncbi:MAG TPA: hypothetical protein VMF10_09720 [Candidatus Aquilonibacter sp.]|nr:hypothetical protein [Candidatus Aquilonibacter sp.]
MTGTVKGTTSLVLAGLGEQSTIIDDGTVLNVHKAEGVFLNNSRMLAATN